MDQASRELCIIPGIGKSLASDLHVLGIRHVSDLVDKDPEILYTMLSKIKNCHQDRCVLYTFRCAVYFAKTENPDPELLKWWKWKD